MPISVYITDDHPLAIEGIQNMLFSSPEINVTGAFINGKELMEALAGKQPDILLLDILLPDGDGIQLADTICKTYPQLKIVALTSLDAPVYVKKMMKSGCKGYVLKNTDKASLINAIKVVHSGEEFIEPVLKEKLIYSMLHTQKAPAIPQRVSLTNREREILSMIMDEYSAQEIAGKLFLSLRTVETHRFNLYKKLGVNNTVSLVKIALKTDLLEQKQ